MSIEPFSISGERVDLIPLHPEHAQETYEILQDPTISQTTSVPFPYTMDMAQQWTRDADRQWAAGSPHWAMVNHENKRLIGAMSLFVVDRKPECFEIGYWTARPLWGEGLASEAVRMAVTAAFERLNATRIEWFAHSGNWGSWKPVWRCGFRREGTERRYNNEDMWQAALIKGDPFEPATLWHGPGGGRSPALDPSQPQKLVEQFHQTYSMPIRLGTGVEPTIDYERLNMRMSLIGEEFAELVGAVYGPAARAEVEAAIARAIEVDDNTRDVVETADALADLIYVIYGMGIESGIDLDAVLKEVQASNLSKLMPDGSVKLREDGKVLKGPDFFPPNIRRALGLRDDT